MYVWNYCMSYNVLYALQCVLFVRVILGYTAGVEDQPIALHNRRNTRHTSAFLRLLPAVIPPFTSKLSFQTSRKSKFFCYSIDLFTHTHTHTQTNKQTNIFKKFCEAFVTFLRLIRTNHGKL